MSSHRHNVLPELAVLVSNIKLCVCVMYAKGGLTPVHISVKQKASLTTNRNKPFAVDNKPKKDTVGAMEQYVNNIDGCAALIKH